MDIPNVLVQFPSGGCTLGSDPGVPHGTLGVIVGIFKLGEIEVDPLRGLFLPVAALQPIQGHRDGLWLVAPVAFRTD